jgi:NAD(P)-dependent dehydrogenase (short-subunit alcohol dehydrogenase family)
MSKNDAASRFALSGKTALVTGGAGILGERFCHGLAESGADVAVVDIAAERAEQLAAAVAKQHGVRAIGISCNVADESDVVRTVKKVVDTFGSIDILLNNAAGKSDDLDKFFAPFEEYSLDQWRLIMSVNIDGMFLMAREVGKQMVAQQRGGSIVQTASIYGAVAPDQRIYKGSHYLNRQINTPAVYSASKAAVIGLTRYLATYWASQKIRVNSLCPGGVESGQNETFVKNYSARVPMGRMARNDEMVGTAIFLASDASRYMTGQNILVDGGLSVW